MAREVRDPLTAEQVNEVLRLLFQKLKELSERLAAVEAALLGSPT